jgi:hypothetical protein
MNEYQLMQANFGEILSNKIPWSRTKNNGKEATVNRALDGSTYPG